jgi:ABC-type microcin C transport system permease subunit YejE
MSKTIKKHSDWGVSYGEMVSREFFKNWLNVASMIFIVFLFAMAVLAPFIANDKPFVIRIDGVLSFPLFRNLNAVDYSVFLAAVLGMFQVWLIRRNKRRVNP